MRVTLLPDLPAGRAIATLVPVLLVTAVAAGSAGRLPLWTGIAGIAAFAGAYEAAYLASPTAFATESVAALTSVLLASAIGVLAAAALAPLTGSAEDELPDVATADIRVGQQEA